METSLTGNIINIWDCSIKYGEVKIENTRISAINYIGEEQKTAPYLLPGFVDAHVHIESSMLTPAQFARLAVVHGTVATVSDPHEIANVLGVAGVEYMIENSKTVPFKFCFGAPSCVPATTFETAGAEISASDIARLLGSRDIGYLAEMMNFPAVLNDDADVMAKIMIAQAFNKPVDGHAPGLRGAAVKKYIDSGIETDHECYTIEEAYEKLEAGMKILIREGSAAKNFEALADLIPKHFENVMFCSDDKHPDSLYAGHINQLVKRSIQKGYDLFKVLRVACVNPVLHYRMSVGLLREGDFADFIMVDDLHNFNVLSTYINGEQVAEQGKTNIASITSEHLNHFECQPIQPEYFKIHCQKEYIRVIEALDGQLITNQVIAKAKSVRGYVESDVANDVLKIAVINRYRQAPPAIGFIKNFGLKEGSIASSVVHDSHNIIVIGVDDHAMTEAVNLIVKNKGGISAVSNAKMGIIPLPIAGLMSDADGYKIAADYTEIDQFVKEKLGCKLTSPFMTLSFMGLLVIPSLKLSDKGLFDGEHFGFVDLFV